MTGYASATAAPRNLEDSAHGNGANSSTTVTVELRSVNSRFLDLTFKIPDECRALEPQLRDVIGQQLRRGKVELRLNIARQGGASQQGPQPEQLMALMRLESTVKAWMPQAAPLSVNEILHWCQNRTSAGGVDELALEATQACLRELAEARSREGARLVASLQERLSRLAVLADAAEPLLPQVNTKFPSDLKTIIR